MTVQWGDTGKASIGPLKTFNITLATPYENLLGSAQSLGTAEPTGGATGDISYTLQSSDFPTITPNPISSKYSAYIVACGQNLSGGSANVSYHTFKNGTATSVTATQSNIANNSYWTQTYYTFPNISVGDTLEFRVWSNVTGVTLMYYAVYIAPTQLELTKADIVKNLNMTLTASTSLTKGNPQIATTGQWFIYPLSTTAVNVGLGSGSYNMLSACINSKSNGYSLGRLNYGDTSTVTYTMSSGTLYPQYVKVTYPSSISFREVLR